MGRPANYSTDYFNQTVAGSGLYTFTQVPGLNYQYNVENGNQGFNTGFANSSRGAVGSGSWRCVSGGYGGAVQGATTYGYPGLWVRYA